ncbi:MAG: polysaccharide deacetylase family protein [Oscillospiraceae bacterium]|nr:polysaccharide deacetylase family protein [Oscillospiraceae bacterium]
MLRKKHIFLFLVILFTTLIAPGLTSGYLVANPSQSSRIATAHAAYSQLPLSGRVVILDPGHGIGSTNVFRGYDEQVAMLDLAQRMRPLLEAQGATVLMIRDTGANVLLPARCAMINIWALEAVRSVREQSSLAEAALAEELAEIDELIGVMQRIIDAPFTYGRIYMNTPFDPMRSIHPTLRRVLELQDEPIIADNFLMISLHSNATPRPIDTSVNGAIVFFISNAHHNTRNYFTGFSHSAQSREFATILLRHIETVGFRNLGAQTANFFVIREHNVPAVLAENGFHTNDMDRARLQSPVYMQRLAYAYRDAIVEYFARRPNRQVLAAVTPAPAPAPDPEPAPPPPPAASLGEGLDVNTLVAARRDSVTYIDGERHYFHTFEIAGQNHIRVRDLAYILSGTNNRFSVSWNAADRAIHLTPGEPYAAVGGELTELSAERLTATAQSVRLIVGGNELVFAAFNYEGDNFFRLRDFANTLGFPILWDASTREILLGSGANQVRYSIAPSTGPASSIRIIEPDRPLVALTFDDGPNRTTSDILDIFSRYNVPATFFVLGSRIAGNGSILTRMDVLGHEIANHSWSHPLLTSASTARVRDEIINTNHAIEAVIGRPPTLFRAPYGAVNARVYDILEELEMPHIRWSLDTRDWQTRNADAIYSSILDHVQNRDIVLSHDIHDQTALAMERVVPSLIYEGYQLVTVSELMCFFGRQLQPGQSVWRG